jgi:hypothetical protein
MKSRNCFLAQYFPSILRRSSRFILPNLLDSNRDMKQREKEWQSDVNIPNGSFGNGEYISLTYLLTLLHPVLSVSEEKLQQNNYW